MKPILVKEGVFSDLCTPQEIEDHVEVCFEQDLRLNFFFSLASTTANVSALPVGTLLDRYGPKLCFLAGSLCLAVGSILMSLAFRIEHFDGYTLGNFFLALGGTFVFLPSFQIANAFPKYGGSIVALVYVPVIAITTRANPLQVHDHVLLERERVPTDQKHSQPLMWTVRSEHILSRKPWRPCANRSIYSDSVSPRRAWVWHL